MNADHQQPQRGAGQTVANLVICRLGAGGRGRYGEPDAACDLIADVLGYFVD